MRELATRARSSGVRGDPTVADGHEPRVAAPLPAGWWAVSVVLLVLGAMLVHLLAANPNIRWDIVADHFLGRDVLLGVLRTIELTAIAMTLGIALGLLLALMRRSPVVALRATSWLFVGVFRAIPLFVLILFWYNIAALIPEVSLGVPFGPTLLGPYETNDVISPFAAGLIALSLSEGAYMAEIIRGGLMSVDPGQAEAAAALGMTRMRAMRRIVLPQAVRVTVPPAGNRAIALLQKTSLVSVTATPELLYSVQEIYNRTFETIPLLVVASLWYLILTATLTVAQSALERRLARGSRHAPAPTVTHRLRTRLETWRRTVAAELEEAR